MNTWNPQVGSVLSAFIASSCCIAPILSLTLGIGGLGAAASLEEYRPYFLGLAFVCLATAFYFTYRKKAACDETCETEKKRRWQKMMLWIAAAVAIVFMGIPYLLFLFI